MQNTINKIQKIKDILEGEGIVLKSVVAIEKGFIKATCKNGYVLAYTPDTKSYTDWAQDIIIEEIPVMLIRKEHRNINGCFSNLKHQATWVQSATVEKVLVKAINEDGRVRIYTPDLKHRTIWVQSATVEKGFVKLTYQDGEVNYYTLDLKRSMGWEDYLHITITKEGFVKAVRHDGRIRIYTPDLKCSTDWLNPITIKDDLVNLFRNDGEIYSCTLDIKS